MKTDHPSNQSSATEQDPIPKSYFPFETEREILSTTTGHWLAVFACDQCDEPDELATCPFFVLATVREYRTYIHPETGERGEREWFADRVIPYHSRADAGEELKLADCSNYLGFIPFEESPYVSKHGFWPAGKPIPASEKTRRRKVA